MTPASIPLVKDVVLIGGGHTHALVLKRWGMRPLPGTRLTVINPGPSAPYTGMLPGLIAGHYALEDLEIELVRLCRFAGARLILGAASGLDRTARTIRVAGRPPVPYDLASIDIGIASDPPDLPGFAAHGTAAKPLGPFARKWRAVLDSGTPGPVAILGAGVGGVELALAMSHALRTRGLPAKVTLVERDRALRGSVPGLARPLLDAVRVAGIELLEGATATEVTADAVRLSDGRSVPSSFTVGVAGARPQGWLTQTGLDHEGGFLTVDRYLRTSDPAVFAAGDTAHLAHAPRPKAGVYAVRAAPALHANLLAALAGTPLKAFEPQADYLKLVSLGRQNAVGERNGLAVTGDWVWRLKDRIDRRFMDGLRDLPAMTPPAPKPPVTRGARDAAGGDAPLCGGCGSKVGARALGAALARLPAAERDALGDDAAIVDVNGTPLVLTTDHLRAFTEDPWLFARITALHALGDIWAMGASPETALLQVVLPPMSPELQERTAGELVDGAHAALAEAGARIVGGHTMTGAEMSLGLSLTGRPRTTPVTLSGARPGDALVLTRPLGSGTILAAEMRGTARGAWVADCLAELSRSQAGAAAALSGARAMTDVTGFGLAGHLLNMLSAGSVGARLDLAAIPFFDGAETLAAQGIRSTVWAENRHAAEGRIDAPDTARAALLHDPQTAGGLLAAIAPKDMKTVTKEIEKTGFQAAVIGEVTEGPPRISAS